MQVPSYTHISTLLNPKSVFGQNYKKEAIRYFITNVNFNTSLKSSPRNIFLPGEIDELYSVDLNLIPPTQIDLALHNDWVKTYGEELFSSKTFKYTNVNFEEIAKLSRK